MSHPGLATGGALAIALSALAPSTTAQAVVLSQGPTDPRTGYGNRFIESIDIVAKSGAGPFAGLAHLGGRIFATTATEVHEFDSAGVYVGSFGPPPRSGITRLFDAATDGRSLLVATDGGVLVVDEHGWPASQVVAAHGPQTVTNPIHGDTWPEHARGLAYDPRGNRGHGSLWVASGASDLFEVDLGGNVLRRLPSRGWNACGLAIDQNGGAEPTIWFNSGPDPRQLTEYWLHSAVPTGNSIDRAQATGAPGGLAGYHGDHGYFGLVAMNCAHTDTVTGYRIDVYGAIPGETHAVLVTGVESSPMTPSSPKTFTAFDGTLTFAVFGPDREPGSSTLPGCLIINPSPWTFADGTTFGVPEFMGLHAASTPVGHALMIPITLPMQPIRIAKPSPPWQDALRVQAVYFDARAPRVVATNQARWVLR